ncbi:MAG: hypothetical protein BMS9Abin02_0281 [Anaerolineae bacterium]|nr:MAG: hypothetical protein BMS9Abin02_0281 [Anaerolineae bacterium]
MSPLPMSWSREAAYEVVEELRPGEAQLVALSLLVLGDEDARSAVGQSPSIAIASAN